MKYFLKYTLSWVSQNLAVPFWTIGHIHLMTSIYADITEVLKELIGNKKWLTIRQIIADSNTKDFEELYRSLFEHIPKYAPGKEGSVTIILNEHLYQANFRIDKEINVMSAIAKIIEVL